MPPASSGKCAGCGGNQPPLTRLPLLQSPDVVPVGEGELVTAQEWCLRCIGSAIQNYTGIRAKKLFISWELSRAMGDAMSIQLSSED